METTDLPISALNAAHECAEQQKESEQKAEKQAKKCTYKRWTQFNNEHTKELMWLAINEPKANALLLFLVDQMDNYNAVMCSHKVLSEVLEVTERTISSAVKVLRDKGFIAVLKSGTSNIYAVNDKVYWKSWENNRQYSKFPANIILALSEQDTMYQQKIIKIKAKKLKEVVIPGTGKVEEIIPEEAAP